MKKIIINDHNLTEEEMELKVIRVKGLLINSIGKILIAHNNDTYQFPGGHKEDNETIDECIIREIKDETGISLTVEEEPFLCIETFDNNYFGSGKKALNCIYYYRFFTDKLPDYSNTHYDELELASDFNLFYLNFDNLKEFIEEKSAENSMDLNIAREMLYVIEEYHKMFDEK